MHDTEHQQHDPELGRERLEHLPGGADVPVPAQIEGDEPEVDEIEADDEQMVDGIGELLVPPQHIGDEDPPIAAEGARHPDGQPDADQQVDDVCDDCEVHVFVLVPVLLERLERVQKCLRGRL
ncbi:hypothetical protein STRTUCAR8_06944 [Streptomyces turgidiscabies Car8]|uniref:Uncharacterized protein n=1 Tax=Streptomyces turgidiscabies (strain Car8) TaxID=698760 RepID=L7EWN5_STRT8|nr:hypothetical protein STRTUCAR8_06944 [Streptomyces turgidiscabies Car8]